LAEELLLSLARHSLNHVSGWKPFQRLLSLQPLLYTPASVMAPGSRVSLRRDGSLNEAEAFMTGMKQWALPPAMYPDVARHGMRIITLVFAFMFDDFDVRRTRTITRAHLDNLLHLTALIDRLVARHIPISTSVPLPSAPAPTAPSDAETSARRRLQDDLNAAATPAEAAREGGGSAGTASVGDEGAMDDPTGGVGSVTLLQRSLSADSSRSLRLTARRGLADDDGEPMNVDTVHSPGDRAGRPMTRSFDDGEDEDVEAWDRDALAEALGTARSAAARPASSGPGLSGSLTVRSPVDGPAAAAAATGAPTSMATMVEASSDDPIDTRAVDQARLIRLDPSERFDGCMVDHMLQLWDRLLTPSPDKANAFLSQGPDAFPASGSLRAMLFTSSLWCLAEYPVCHPEAMKSLMRLKRLAAAWYPEVVPRTRGGLTIVDTATDPGTAMAGGTGGGGGGSTAPGGGTRPRSESRTRRPSSHIPTSGASTGRGSGDGDEWLEVEQPGRPGMTAEKWLLMLISHVHAFLVKVAGVVTAFDRIAGDAGLTLDTLAVPTGSALPPPPTPLPAAADSTTAVRGYDAHVVYAALALLPLAITTHHVVRAEHVDTTVAAADIAMTLLQEAFTSCHHAADVAHTQLTRFQAFLEGYQVFKAARSRAEAAAMDRDTEPTAAASTAPADAAASLSWDWLVGDIRGHGGDAGAGGEGTGPAGGAVSAALDPRRSSAWVKAPSFSKAVRIAADSLETKDAEAVSFVDDMLLSTWKGIVHLLREHTAVLKPVIASIVVAQQAAERQRVTSLSPRGEHGFQAPAAVAAAAAQAVHAVNAMAGAGRAAFRRITSTVRRNIGETVAAVLGGDMGIGDVIGDDMAEAEDGSDSEEEAGFAGGVRTSSGSTISLRTDLPPWVSHTVALQVGPVRVREPAWFTAGWSTAQQRCQACFVTQCVLDATRRFINLARREDALATVRIAHQIVLHGMLLQGGAWAGDSRIDAAAQRLSSHEDALRRRLILKPNLHPSDYTAAAYKKDAPTPASMVAPTSPAAPTTPGDGDHAHDSAPGALPPALNTPGGGAGGLMEPFTSPAMMQLTRMVVARGFDPSKASGAGAVEGDDDGDAGLVAGAGGGLPGSTKLRGDSSTESRSGRDRSSSDYSSGSFGSDGTSGGGDGVSLASAGESSGRHHIHATPSLSAMPRTYSDSGLATPGGMTPLAGSMHTLEATHAAMSAYAGQGEPQAGVTLFALLPSERMVLQARSKLVTVDGVINGVLKVSTRHVFFEPDTVVFEDDGEDGPDGDDEGDVYSTAAAPKTPGASRKPRTGSGGYAMPHIADHTMVEEDEAAVAAEGKRRQQHGLTGPRSHIHAQPKRWSLDMLVRLLPRRYLLQNCALEAFFVDGTTVFMAFSTRRVRDVFDAIFAQKPARLLSRQVKSLTPMKHLKATQVRQRWQRREISNFEYLMELNTLAGRTFNDLSQYPVFPWVIANYTSPTLDLSDPGNYRDLSKPMGALNPDRLEYFRQRLDDMEGGPLPPFMYGSHYSTAGFVIYFLMRMEP